MLKKLIGKVHRGQRGITGLETAIILIAFVVVASVFAYTVLSAGIFSSQKGQEAIYSGLEQTRSTLEPKGSVVGYKGTVGDTNALVKVEFTVANALEGEPVDLTPPYTFDGTNLSESGLDNVTQIAYSDKNLFISDCAWTLDWVGKHTDDYLLEDNEKAVITVWLVNYSGGSYSLGSGASDPFIDSTANLVGTNHTFTLEVKPPNGATLNIERTTPAHLDTVMDLQ